MSVIDFGWGNADRATWSTLPDLPPVTDEVARRRMAKGLEAIAVDVHRLTLDWPGLRYVPGRTGPILEIEGIPGRVVTQGDLARGEALAHHRRTWHGRPR